MFYMITVTSFGCLGKECVQVFEAKGGDVIIRMITHEKPKYRMSALMLVVNLAIDSDGMRDFLIKKGAVEAILQALSQYSKMPIYYL